MTADRGVAASPAVAGDGLAADADRPLVGVLALQGGVAEHAAVVQAAGGIARWIRTPADLAGVDALILPGGESSTTDRLVRMFGLADPLRGLIADGLPTLATCAGMIELAARIEDPAPGQQSLGVLDITVRRNAFGPQVDSADTVLDTADGPIRAAFIRAPEVVTHGPDVAVIARHLGRIVGVRAGAVTAVAFHPELTGDLTLHRRLVAAAAATGPDRAPAAC